MESDALVVKSNSLIRSRYDYTLAELRLVITVASMIRGDDTDFQKYSVEAKEFSALMGADKDNTYKSLKELGKLLLSKPIEIDDGEGGFGIYNWFSSYQYKAKEGRIMCSFHPDLKPHFIELQGHFTKYNLTNILQMKSTYSIRLYELAKSWEDRKWFTIEVEKFKGIMGCSGQYELYANLKAKVIDRAIKEINTLTDIEVSYQEKKTGRKVTSLEFKIVPKHKPIKLEVLHEGVDMTGEQFNKFVVQLDSNVVDMKYFKNEALKLSTYHGCRLDTELLSRLKVALISFRKGNSLF